RSFSELKENENVINDKKFNLEEINNITFKEYKLWIEEKSFIDTFTLEELKFFDNLHELLSNKENIRGISFRVLQGIADYINNIPSYEEETLISREEAFDICVKQRILTKIKGSDRELEGLINSSNNDELGSLYKFFNSNDSRKISDFTEVKLRIKQKSEGLKKYGYTN
ncbi:hypothetical protein, partial [Clostridium perfringens]